MAFSADGTYYPTQTDAFDVAGDIEKTAKSIPGVIVPVANATERDSYTAARTAEGRAPSTADPLYVDRGDTGLIERNNGSGWRVVNSWQTDALAYKSGVTPLTSTFRPRLIRVGNIVYCYGGVTISGSLTSRELFTIPANFAPPSGGTHFAGTCLTSNGQVFALQVFGNVFRLATYGTGSLAVGENIPVTASWSFD